MPLTRHESAAYTQTLKTLTDEQLFEAWSHEYDAEHVEHVALILSEMDLRSTKRDNGVIEL